MWKCPRLAGKVGDLANFDADLFADLATHAVLDGFAGFDETRQRAEHAGGEAMRAGQQQVAAACDQRHHRGGDPWIGDQSACRALLRSFAGMVMGGRAAASTKAMTAIPIDHLKRACGECQQGLGDLEKKCAQADVPHAGRFGCFVRQIQRHACDLVEVPKEMACARDAGRDEGCHVRHRIHILGHVDRQHLVTAKCERVRGGGQWRRQCVRGREA